MELIVIEYSEQSHKTQYQIGQKPTFYRRKNEQAVEIKGETTEDIDEENVLKANKVIFLAIKIEISDEKKIQESEQINLTESFRYARRVKK